MTTYVAKLMPDADRIGTFKARLYDYAIESGARKVTKIGFSSESLLLDNKEFSYNDDILLVLNNTKMNNVKFLLSLPHIRIINPPQYREINKLDVWKAAMDSKVSTPKIAIGTNFKFKLAIMKPI